MPSIRDSFDRPDGPLGSTDTGETWLDHFGTWRVESHRARQTVPSVTGAETPQRLVTVPAAADGVVSVVVAVPEQDTGGAGTVFRFVDTANHWRAFAARLPGGPLQFFLDHVVAGTYTTKVTGGVANAGDRVGARFDGSTVSLLVNGVSVGSVVDSALVAATRAGMTCSPPNFTATVGIGRLDSFEFDSIAGPGGWAIGGVRIA